MAEAEAWTKTPSDPAVIPGTFFITALGRSGTKFLAGVLGRSRRFRVIHEAPGDAKLDRFPLGRFRRARFPTAWRRGYGEVNSYLRFHVDARNAGPEARIERRGIIARDPRDAIRSAMNRSGRTLADFESTARAILGSYDRLIALTEHPTLEYARFEFSRITRDPDHLREIAEWAGIDDVRPTAGDLGERVNVNRKEWFPRFPDWPEAVRSRYAALEEEIVAPSRRWGEYAST